MTRDRPWVQVRAPGPGDWRHEAEITKRKTCPGAPKASASAFLRRRNAPLPGASPAPRLRPLPALTPIRRNSVNNQGYATHDCLALARHMMSLSDRGRYALLSRKLSLRCNRPQEPFRKPQNQVTKYYIRRRIIDTRYGGCMQIVSPRQQTEADHDDAHTLPPHDSRGGNPRPAGWLRQWPGRLG